MTTIKIEKLNEVYLHIHCEDMGVESELVDFFTYEFPGAKFTPMFKARLWDGRVRLMDPIRKTLYVGLYDYVVRFAEANGYEIELLNEIEHITDIKLEQVERFTEELNLYGRGQPIDVRDYQQEAIHTSLANSRVVLLSPTGSGKSLIIYSICRWHLEDNKKCLIVVPSTSLVEQMYSDFADYSTGNGWDVAKMVQKIYSGFPKEIETVRILHLEDGNQLTLKGSEFIETINKGNVQVKDLTPNDDIDPNWIARYNT